MRGLLALTAGLALAGGLLWLLLDTRADREATAASATVVEQGDGGRKPDSLRPVPDAERARAATPTALAAADTSVPDRGSTAAAAAAAETCVVRVVDALDRSPLAGASVRSTDAAWAFEGTTDAGGRVRVPLEHRGQFLPLRAEAAGHAPTESRRQVAAEIEIELYRLGSIAGRVLDAQTNTPIVGARVAFKTPLCSGCAPDVTSSDDEGRYALRVPPVKGQVGLAAIADGYALQRLRTDVDTASGFEWTFDLRLEHGTRVVGTVHDMVDGSPLAGVSLGHELAGLTPTTDENGRFEIRVLPEVQTGALDLQLRKAGYCALFASVTRERAADPAPLRLPLVQGAPLSGRVVAPDGTGVPYAWVHVWDDPRNETDDPASPLDALPSGWQIRDASGSVANTATDAEGAFAFEGGVVPWRASRDLAVSAEGFESSVVTLPVLAPGEPHELEVVLTPEPTGAVIRGRVTLNGDDVQARLSWRGPTRNGRGVHFPRMGYTLEVEAGTITLAVTPHEFGGDDVPFELSAEAALEVEAGTEVTHDFALEAPARTIRGRVRWDDGRPVPDADVRAELVTTLTAKTGTDGSFALDVPDLGRPYSLYCESGTNRVRQHDVTAGTSGVELVLQRTGTLRVRAVDATTGALIEQPELAWRSLDGGSWHRIHSHSRSDVEVLDDGAIELTLPWGALELAVAQVGHGYLAAVAPVEVRPAARTEHTAALTRVDPIVFVAASVPPREATIRLLRQDDEESMDSSPLATLERSDRFEQGPFRSSHDLTFDDNGRALVHGLPDASYLLVSELTLSPATIVVGPDRSKPIELTWERPR